MHDNLVLIDHPADTLWSQLLGQGIKGAWRGSVLEVFPSTVTTWEIWYRAYPETSVLSAERMGYIEDLPDAYGGYFDSGAVGLSGAGKIDSRLPAKDLVIGVVLGENVITYPLDSILAERIIVDQVGDYTLSVIWDEELGIGRVFLGDIASDLQDSAMMDLESLAPLPSQLVYWFAWTSFYPQSGLY